MEPQKNVVTECFPGFNSEHHMEKESLKSREISGIAVYEVKQLKKQEGEEKCDANNCGKHVDTFDSLVCWCS